MTCDSLTLYIIKGSLLKERKQKVSNGGGKKELPDFKDQNCEYIKERMGGKRRNLRNGNEYIEHEGNRLTSPAESDNTLSDES